MIRTNAVFRIRLLFALLFLPAVIAIPAAGQAPGNWTQVGMLTCKLNPSIGFIIAGHQSMECRYVPSNPANPPQAYQGALNTVGIDIGVSAGGVLGWAVLAPTTGIPPAPPAPEYLGPSPDPPIALPPPLN